MTFDIQIQYVLENNRYYMIIESESWRRSIAIPMVDPKFRMLGAEPPPPSQINSTHQLS